jgi:hypothetical protein
MPGDFTSRSVAEGLQIGEFRDLPENVRSKLVRLMARISEASYRRGLQQGGVIKEPITPPNELRHEHSLDLSPYTNSLGGSDAITRLFAEYGELHAIGFDEPAC